MPTDPNRDVEGTKAFVFDMLVGAGGLTGVGYAGYEMRVFAGVTDSVPSIAIVSGALLGACSVAIMETDRFRILFERPIIGMVAATAMMCVVTGVVWALSQAGPSRAIYTVLGVIAAALVTRICVFASRRARSEGATQ